MRKKDFAIADAVFAKQQDPGTDVVVRSSRHGSSRILAEPLPEDKSELVT
jgi:hypothetical protein